MEVDDVTRASRSDPVKFPSRFPRMPRLNAVVPPATSATVNAPVINELVSVRRSPFCAGFRDAVTLTADALMAEITLPTVAPEAAAMVAVFPERSVMLKDPAGIPAPPDRYQLVDHRGVDNTDISQDQTITSI